jgi:hypothetical protein
MFRFLLAALLWAAVVVPTAPAQNYPEQYRGYPAHQRAYPADPEALVRSWYQKYLGREVDPSGYSSWVNSLTQGSPPEAVLATILASDEYFQRAGNTPEGFIQQLFRDFVGRGPTRGEFDLWVRRVYSDDRRDIAYALLRRHPQTWGASSYDPRGESPHDYDYRRPFSRYYPR